MWDIKQRITSNHYPVPLASTRSSRSAKQPRSTGVSKIPLRYISIFRKAKKQEPLVSKKNESRNSGQQKRSPRKLMKQP